MDYEVNADTLKITFFADSDAKIIRALLALVLELSNDKTAKEILEIDFSVTLTELGLQQHLSPSRGNGLLAVIEKIQGIAKSQVLI